MGWTFCQKPTSVRQYLDGLLTWTNKDSGESFKVLSSSVVNFHEYYAAVEKRDINNNVMKVFAAVFMLAYNKDPDGYNFGYKDMDEGMGPCITNCPKKILNLLTPLEATEKYAIDWRKECWDNINKRKYVKNGDTVSFSTPISFTDGSKESVFTVVKSTYGRKIRFRGANGLLYRFPRKMLSNAVIS